MWRLEMLVILLNVLCWHSAYTTHLRGGVNPALHACQAKNNRRITTTGSRKVRGSTALAWRRNAYIACLSLKARGGSYAQA